MYAKIENNEIVEYPLSEFDIKDKFPNTSFPHNFSENLPEGYIKVLSSGNPGDNEYQISVRGTPVKQGDDWIETWVFEDRYTPEELTKYNSDKVQNQWDSMRDKRDGAIKESSWIIERHREQLELGVNTTITNGEYLAWLSYRQELRDYPQTITDINSVRLPNKPSELGITNV